VSIHVLRFLVIVVVVAIFSLYQPLRRRLDFSGWSRFGSAILCANRGPDLELAGQQQRTTGRLADRSPPDPRWVDIAPEAKSFTLQPLGTQSPLPGFLRRGILSMETCGRRLIREESAPGRPALARHALLLTADKISVEAQPNFRGTDGGRFRRENPGEVLSPGGAPPNVLDVQEGNLSSRFESEIQSETVLPKPSLFNEQPLEEGGEKP